MASELPSLTQNKSRWPLASAGPGKTRLTLNRLRQSQISVPCKRDAFHADRAAKTDVRLQHAIAVQIAQFDVVKPVLRFSRALSG